MESFKEAVANLVYNPPPTALLALGVALMMAILGPRYTKRYKGTQKFWMTFTFVVMTVAAGIAAVQLAFLQYSGDARQYWISHLPSVWVMFYGLIAVAVWLLLIGTVELLAKGWLMGSMLLMLAFASATNAADLCLLTFSDSDWALAVTAGLSFTVGLAITAAALGIYTQFGRRGSARTV